MARVRTKAGSRRTQLSIIVTEDQQTALQALSACTLAPINALVRAAIDDYLEKRKADWKTVRLERHVGQVRRKS